MAPQRLSTLVFSGDNFIDSLQSTNNGEDAYQDVINILVKSKNERTTEEIERMHRYLV